MAHDTHPATTPVYDVFSIPTPPTPSDISHYRETRLTALQTDPNNFLSTHAREVALPDETWRERLSGTEKATFVARLRTTPDGSAESGGPFVGMVTVLPAQGSPLPLPVAAADPSTAYIVVAMWIAPEHRRRGLGRKLLDASLAWAAADVHRKAPDADVETKAEVFLFLALDNVMGRGLYESAGFESMGVTTAPGGRGEVQWMRRWVGASDSMAPTTAA